MIKTFTSYHHANDQIYKEQLCGWAANERIIEDHSVNTNEIDTNLPTETIRRRIRDEYLRDSQVTILLCGTETRFRKHVDWELKSSMIEGTRSKSSGILVVNLPTINDSEHAAYGQAEKHLVYADYFGSWSSVYGTDEYIKRHPNLPRRIAENLNRPEVKISIVNWDRIFGYPQRLSFLLQHTANSANTNVYDLSRKMRMKNFNPRTDRFDFRV